MKFHCVYCGQAIEVHDDAAAQSTTCPGCNAEVAVPLPKKPESPIPSSLAQTKPELEFLSATKLSEPTYESGLAFELRRLFLYSLIACLAVGAFTAFFSLFSAALGKYQSRILLTTFSFGIYSVTGLCCAVLREKSRGSVERWIGSLGIAASIAGALFAVLTNWEIITGWDILIRGRFSFFIIAASFAHASLILMIDSEVIAVGLLRSMTLLAIFLLSSLILIAMVGPGPIGLSEIFIPGCAIISVFGTMATPLLHFATRRRKPD